MKGKQALYFEKGVENEMRGLWGFCWKFPPGEKGRTSLIPNESHGVEVMEEGGVNWTNTIISLPYEGRINRSCAGVRRATSSVLCHPSHGKRGKTLVHHKTASWRLRGLRNVKHESQRGGRLWPTRHRHRGNVRFQTRGGKNTGTLSTEKGQAFPDKGNWTAAAVPRRQRGRKRSKKKTCDWRDECSFRCSRAFILESALQSDRKKVTMCIHICAFYYCFSSFFFNCRLSWL